MKAEIIAVGTELLLGQIANTNARFVSEQLALVGVGVYFHTVVGDNRGRLLSVLQAARQRSDLVILCGGLGPTEDDLTRETVAEFLGRPLELHPEALRAVEGYFSGLGRDMPENNRRQAMVIQGGNMIPNPRGTAPGQYVEAEGRRYVLLPGPPTEFEPMVRESVIPLVQTWMGGNETIRSRVLRLYGIGESHLAERIADLLAAQDNPTLAPLAAEGEVTLRLTARAASEKEAWERIAPLEAELRRRLGRYIYGVDAETLEVAAGRVLQARGMTVATAESCTGGLLGEMITNVPGSSRYFVGGVISYSNDVKKAVLGVSGEILERLGAVSEPVAIQMAQGVAEHLGADWGIGITGIAGPDGGTETKPVGLVYIAVHHRNADCWVKEFRFRGDRRQVRIRAAKAALFALWRKVGAMDEGLSPAER
ncbi:MAG: competence/damage-inducible protein A [Kyrpidia tusciae]|nr:competence/damage-inducible protein A [Kyrpidia tusciae]MBE3553126.1 competence/damage-inducible protein A [Kyrpidia tusciae]